MWRLSLVNAEKIEIIMKTTMPRISSLVRMDWDVVGVRAIYGENGPDRIRTGDLLHVKQMS